MNQIKGFGPHEVMELHELLVGEVTAGQKMQSMMSVIHDKDLQEYMKWSLQMKQQRISGLEKLMETAKNTTF